MTGRQSSSLIALRCLEVMKRPCDASYICPGPIMNLSDRKRAMHSAWFLIRSSENQEAEQKTTHCGDGAMQSAQSFPLGIMHRMCYHIELGVSLWCLRWYDKVTSGGGLVGCCQAEAEKQVALLQYCGIVPYRTVQTNTDTRWWGYHQPSVRLMNLRRTAGSPITYWPPRPHFNGWCVCYVLYSTVRYSTLRYGTVRYGTVRYRHAPIVAYDVPAWFMPYRVAAPMADPHHITAHDVNPIIDFIAQPSESHVGIIWV